MPINVVPDTLGNVSIFAYSLWSCQAVKAISEGAPIIDKEEIQKHIKVKEDENMRTRRSLSLPWPMQEQLQYPSRMEQPLAVAC